MNTRIISEHPTYLRPRDLDEALDLLAKYGSEAKVLAAGTDLLVAIKTGKARPRYLVDIMGIPALGTLAFADHVTIGAGVLHRQIEKSHEVQARLPLLVEVEERLGSVQVRNMATVGGNICNASPCADAAVALLALDASLKIVSTRGQRQVPLRGFSRGPGQTTLEADELLAEISVPPLPPGTGSAYRKVVRVSMDLAKISVAVVMSRSGELCSTCRIAIGSAAPIPLLAEQAAALLTGRAVTSELAEEAASRASRDIAPITDVRSTAEYRRRVSKVIVRDAVLQAWKASFANGAEARSAL